MRVGGSLGTYEARALVGSVGYIDNLKNAEAGGLRGPTVVVTEEGFNLPRDAGCKSERDGVTESRSGREWFRLSSFRIAITSEVIKSVEKIAISRLGEVAEPIP